jgi:hypothetical protein
MQEAAKGFPGGQKIYQLNGEEIQGNMEHGKMRRRGLSGEEAGIASLSLIPGPIESGQMGRCLLGRRSTALGLSLLTRIPLSVGLCFF